MVTIRADTLWQLAQAKWAEIGASQPDLAPALALQQGMLRILIDATQRLQDSAAGLPELAPEAVRAKWARGLPALRGESIPIPQTLKDILPPLCDTLAGGGAGLSATHIKDALANGGVDADSLLRVSLARNQKAIRTSSLHMGFAPDLVWLIGELGSSPLANLYYARVMSTPSLETAVRDWDHGYCPVCGSWPAFIEVLNEPGSGSTASGGTRWLRCSFCAAAWALTSSRCIYCGVSDSRFVAAAPDVRCTDRRIELCGGCGNYTKVIEATTQTPFPLLAIDDLASLDLDQGAMSREYGRPSLFDLDTIDPPQGCL